MDKLVMDKIVTCQVIFFCWKLHYHLQTTQLVSTYITPQMIISVYKEKAPSSFRTQGFRKMAATYSPAGVQYHRRSRA